VELPNSITRSIHSITRLPDYPITRFLALAAFVFASAALAIAASPERRSFAVDGRPPRLLHSAQEIAVPLTVINTGGAAWDPARGRRPAPIVVAFVAAADVIWCAATLLSKQLLLVREALLEPTAVAYWLIVVAALGPPLVMMAVLPRRVRVWALLACGALGTL